MPFDVRIFFTGMIGFVPSTDGKKLRALLLNAINGGMNHGGMNHGGMNGNGVTIGRHEPLLAYARANLPAADQPNFTKKFLKQPLINLELSLDPQNGPLTAAKGLRRKSMGTLDEIPETLSEGADFSWVADMTRITGGGQSLPAGSLGGVKDGPVTAHLTLQSGSWEVFQFCKYDEKVPVFEFRDEEGSNVLSGYRQALSDIIVAAMTLPDSVKGINLSLTEYGGGATTKIQLLPVAKRIDLLVGNVSALLGKNEKPERRAVHFSLYYSLLGQPPATAFIPYVTPTEKDRNKVEDVKLPEIFNAILGPPKHGGPFRPICNQVQYAASAF